jgi:hypothetical protein
MEKHAKPGAGRHPWEYAIIFYNAEEGLAAEKPENE